MDSALYFDTPATTAHRWGGSTLGLPGAWRPWGGLPTSGLSAACTRDTIRPGTRNPTAANQFILRGDIAASFSVFVLRGESIGHLGRDLCRQFVWLIPSPCQGRAISGWPC